MHKRLMAKVILFTSVLATIFFGTTMIGVAAYAWRKAQ